MIWGVGGHTCWICRSTAETCEEGSSPGRRRTRGHPETESTEPVRDTLHTSNGCLVWEVVQYCHLQQWIIFNQDKKPLTGFSLFTYSFSERQRDGAYPSMHWAESSEPNWTACHVNTVCNRHRERSGWTSNLCCYTNQQNTQKVSFLLYIDLSVLFQTQIHWAGTHLLVHVQLGGVRDDLGGDRHAPCLQLHLLGLLSVVQSSTAHPDETNRNTFSL